MTILTLALAAALAIASVLFVALPLIQTRRGEEAELHDPTPAELQRLTLLEERDRALGALHDLEFDRRSEKIDIADYEYLRALLRREAADVLQRLEDLGAGPVDPAAIDESESPANGHDAEAASDEQDGS